MVEHGVCQPHAADPSDAHPHRVWRVLAPASPIVGAIEGLAAVLTLGTLNHVRLPPLASVAGGGGAREEGAWLIRDHRGEPVAIGATVALIGSEGGVRVRGRQGRCERVGVLMFLDLRLGKVDVGFSVVYVDELVPHGGVTVVLVACEPGALQLASRAVLCGMLPAALSRVDADDLLVLLEGDMAGQPRERL